MSYTSTFSSIQDFSAVISSSDVRPLLRNELVGNVIYNDNTVLNTFAIDEALQTWSQSVAASIRQVHVSNLDKLERVSEGDGREHDMYKPLFDIFRFIEGAHQDRFPRSQYRQLVCMANDIPNPEGVFIAEGKPDFVLAETAPPKDSNKILTDLLKPKGIRWRQLPSFIEVKQKEIESPYNPRPGTVKPVLGQFSDYGRLSLTARPFQLFAAGILIYGMKFCVGRFDRSGIVLSKEMDISDDLEMFVAIIRRMTCELSPVQLGHDPTVTLLPGQTYYQEEYPSFRVTLGGIDTHVWHTIGCPLWSSLSLLGRGSSTWHAYQGNTEQITEEDEVIVILKTTWRSVSRVAEATIYERVGRLKGVATFSTGGDVDFPARSSGSTIPISTQCLRQDAGIATCERNSVLHRLSLSSAGRPLWDCTEERELVAGFKAALEGHRRMSEKGFLHRDVSAGNVLLADGEADPGYEGFLADLDLTALSHEPNQSILAAAPADLGSPEQQGRTSCSIFTETVISSEKKASGPEMTGTVIFMAKELLVAISESKTIPRTIYHDLESFALVFIYVIYRFVLQSYSMSSDDKTLLQDEFHGVFGGYSVTDVLNRRRTMQDTPVPHLLALLQRNHLAIIVFAYCAMIDKQNPKPAIAPSIQAMFNKSGDPYPFLADIHQAVPPKYMSYDHMIGTCDYYLGLEGKQRKAGHGS